MIVSDPATQPYAAAPCPIGSRRPEELSLELGGPIASIRNFIHELYDL